MLRIEIKKSKYITKKISNTWKKGKKGSEKIIRNHNKTGDKMAIHIYISINFEGNGVNAPI